jgi:hypothetical protein
MTVNPTILMKATPKTINPAIIPTIVTNKIFLRPTLSIILIATTVKNEEENAYVSSNSLYQKRQVIQKLNKENIQTYLS